MSVEKLQNPASNDQEPIVSRSAMWFENSTRQALKRLRARFLTTSAQSVTDQEKYIPLETTLAAAKLAGMSVEDYIDDVMSGTPGATRHTLQAMAQLGVFDSPIRAVAEIGPGSGRYLAHTIAACTPDRYEIYETAAPWAKYLVATYGVIWQPTDGTSLAATADESVDLVQAHKVFNSINFTPTCRYWSEMARVLRPGGYCVFDIMSDACLTPDMIQGWNDARLNFGSYPAAMPRAAAVDYFSARHITLIGSFFGPLGPGITEVLVFRKNLVAPKVGTHAK